MSLAPSCRRFSKCSAAALALLALAAGLSGCAEMGDGMSTAFADPAKYDLYDCKQLQAERKTLANRTAELQGLMAKAQTGAAGPVVVELAYRNDYIAVRGQSNLAEEAWRKNRCQESKLDAEPSAGAVAAPITPAPLARGARAPSRVN
ncbi:twin-arginine translocation pathway signal [Bradyrhizobium sp.]|uniref:twin-arginine translocation pathway signal n=1 Tax=Bradyrhizobium sp. TaxID=376 RepID=UPI0025BB6DDD|nr:twin-arginine translocation pathway signal [Bradyrhizobium sp.]